MISVNNFAFSFRNSTFKSTFISRSIRKGNKTFIIEEYFYQFFACILFADFRLTCICNKETSFPVTFHWDPIFISFSAFSDRLSLIPLSFIHSSVRPSFHPVPFRFPINPLSIINLSVWKQASPFSHLGIRPLSLKNRAILQCLCPKTSCFTLEPSSFVDGSIRKNFPALTMRSAVKKLTSVFTTVRISACPMSLRRTSNPVSIEYCPVWHFLDSLSMKEPI
jgi:hypothetical protein